MQSDTARFQYDKNPITNTDKTATGSMPKADREEVVLRLLAEIDEPLPPLLIYRILRVRGATFGRRSVLRYCSELGERGELLKIDPAEMENGDLEQIDPSEKGYWMISEAGRERIND